MIYKKIIGLDEDGNRVNLELTLIERTDKYTTIDGLKIGNHYGLTISGHSANYAGQIHDRIKSKIDDYARLFIKRENIDRIIEIWERWHLNIVRPYCRHQRDLGWDIERIDEDKPSDTYGKYFPGQRSPSWNLTGWVTEREHPKGKLAKPCPVCGYKYGTDWLVELIPQEIIDEIVFLFS